MLNNNWVSMLRTIFIQNDITNNLKNTSGTATNIYYGGYRNVMGSSIGRPSTNWVEITSNVETDANSLGAGKGGFFLLMGASDTEPTVEDYKLGNVLTDYSTISQSHYFNNSNEVINPSFMTLTRMVQNETASPITIKEIGAYYKYEGSIPVMIAREAIEPVTLQPGEKHSFTMDICVQ